MAKQGRPMPGGQPNMQQLMKQAQKMQAQMLEAQQKLAETELTGTAGGGLVTATVTGAGEVLRIVIDPKVVDPDDVETLEDLVTAAVRDGQKQASELGETAMGPVAGGAQGLLGGL
jgi:DNA-binding YbaB/EbfC family protein